MVENKIENRVTDFIKIIRNWIIPEVMPEEKEEFQRVNLKHILMVSEIAGLIAAFVLLFFVIFHKPLTISTRSIISAGFGVVASLCVNGIARLWQHQHMNLKNHIPVFLGILYWILSLWGMEGSFRSYASGRQMILFHTVQIGFAMFVCFYPLGSLLYVFLSYTIFYYVLLQYDQAVRINIINWYMLAVVVVCGYVIRYRSILRDIREKKRMEANNLALYSDSIHDGLTGLKNRLALRQDFSGYVGKTIWCIMADVDYFKQYNDTYGHAVGDQLLIRIANEAKTIFGDKCVYRYGGDEFLIIFESEIRDLAQFLLVVWKREIAKIKIDAARNRITPRCSAGMAGGFVENEENIRRYIQEADQRLYAVKKNRK